MYKIINWYTKHFKFPKRGWKFFRSFLRGTGNYNKFFHKKLHNAALMRVCPAEHVQQQVFWYGFYEKEAVLTWETLIGKEDTVIDIGANAGYYTLIAAPGAKQVIAFEPSRKMREQLEENIKLNAFTNILVESYAISDENGAAELYTSAADNTGMTGLRPPGNFSGEKETVSVITLDDWATKNNLSAVNIIKMDVEGAEWNVLSGMKNILSRHRPLLFVEVMNELLAKYGHTAEDVYQLLKTYGYSAYEIPAPNTLKPVTTAIESYNILFLPDGFAAPAGIDFTQSR